MDVSEETFDIIDTKISNYNTKHHSSHTTEEENSVSSIDSSQYILDHHLTDDTLDLEIDSEEHLLDHIYEDPLITEDSTDSFFSTEAFETPNTSASINEQDSDTESKSSTKIQHISPTTTVNNTVSKFSTTQTFNNYVLPVFLRNALSVELPINQWIARLTPFLQSKNHHTTDGTYFANIEVCHNWQHSSGSTLHNHPLSSHIWNYFLECTPNTGRPTVEGFVESTSEDKYITFVGVPDQAHNLSEYLYPTIYCIKLDIFHRRKLTLTERPLIVVRRIIFATPEVETVILTAKPHQQN